MSKLLNGYSISFFALFAHLRARDGISFLELLSLFGWFHGKRLTMSSWLGEMARSFTNTLMLRGADHLVPFILLA
jgi:hypothetical protein